MRESTGLYRDGRADLTGSDFLSGKGDGKPEGRAIGGSLNFEGSA